MTHHIVGCIRLGCNPHTRLAGTDCTVVAAGRIEDSHTPDFVDDLGIVAARILYSGHRFAGRPGLAGMIALLV